MIFTARFPEAAAPSRRMLETPGLRMPSVRVAGAGEARMMVLAALTGMALPDVRRPAGPSVPSAR